MIQRTEYTIYNLTTGKPIRRCMVANEEQAKQQVLEGEGLFSGVATEDDLIVGGRLKKRPAHVIARRNKKPEGPYVWDDELEDWVDPRDTQTKAKHAKDLVVREIEDLEKGQARAIREAILTGNKSRLQEIEDRIAQLRPKLK